ncbi:MAG: uncharacterized protein QOJ56_3094 [Mycobacterium sp.]|jgi:hypothetical protein|nr:uncharacterized protein [Mycobacterium sp.]MDT5354562.1 uncharacterized protein [Mycobacterium sp.]MDT7720878.1 uncharacterized protein [Mycobacterium sp.]
MNAIPVTERSLYWIEGTDRRFDGYNFFDLHPRFRSSGSTNTSTDV